MYLLVLLPGEELSQSIKRLQEDLARRSGDAHVLEAPPHLTLLPPFAWEHQDLPLETILSEILHDFRPFSVVLHGVGNFEPRVIFLHVLQNRSLRALQRRLRKHLAPLAPMIAEDTRRFHPHITLLSRIPTLELFCKWKRLYGTREFHGSFRAQAVSLLQYDQGEWKEILQIPFRGGEDSPPSLPFLQ